MADSDREALEANGGQWHDGHWKGKFASDWRMTREAVEMMNNAMIDGINANVGMDDTLWHLGDFCFAPRGKYHEHARMYRDRIHCQHVNIVWGNHDRRREMSGLFEQEYDLVTVEAQGQRARMVLCHYALAVWDGSHRGNWNLYGHSHCNAEKWMDEHMPDRKSMDVGIDNAYRLLDEFRPFSLEEIRTMIMGRLGHTMDQHIPRNSQEPAEEDLL
jgi:calcineurin-like phosphoesterase family protein